MAQFGKSLFGSSYFGYTNTLDGDYQTEIIDADEPFDGKVDFKIWAELPEMKYDSNDVSWTFLPLQTDWKKNGNNLYTTKKDSYAMFSMSADELHFEFEKSDLGAIALIEIIDPRDNSIVITKQIDTKIESSFKTTIPFQMVNIKIKNTESKKLELKYIKARVTTFGVEVKTKPEKDGWNNFKELKMIYNQKEKYWEGSSEDFTQIQYVQAKIHLGTSDYNISPIIDKIIVSSGDTSKRSNHGYWSCAFHMENIAEEQKTTFKKVKKVTYNRDLPDTTITDLRSTSTIQTFPNKDQIKDDLYWKPETAPYVFYKNTKTSLGTPFSRISLPKNLTNSYVVGFEMSPEEFNLTNSKLVQWISWNDQSYYPTDSAGTSISYKIYENKNDYEKGIPPIFIINNPERIVDRKLALPSRFLKRNLFVFIEITRSNLNTKQTPVVDFIDLIGDVKYLSPVNTGSQTKEISALDNGTGISKQEDFNSNRYDWPNNNQVLDINKESLKQSTRTLTIKYTPLFSNQIEFYLKKKESELTNRNRIEFPSTIDYVDEIYSKVIADEPLASTYEAPKDRIIFHYAMDGGSVQYPKETVKELLTDYSPNLLQGVKYQFKVDNGWPDETYAVPYAMTWTEISDNTASRIDELKEINTVEEYDGKIPQGVVIKLPNHTANKLINLKFQSNSSSFTKKSLWNNLENDKIIAKIPSNKDFGYKEWISEEKIYEGYINPNNIRHPYIRNQNAVYSSTDEYEYVIRKGDTYTSIAKEKGSNEIDLSKRNGDKELIVGDKLIIPASFALPYIAPEVIYENENPFIIELIPFSIYKKNMQLGFEPIEEQNIIFGSDTDDVLKYTYIESEPVTNELQRGPVLNGRDSLLYSNPQKIHSVVDSKNGYIYQPYSKGSNGTETGDYILKDGYIDWSPSHKLAKEPEKDSYYKVTYTYNTIDTLRITMTSDYVEKSGYNKLWKSPEIKEINGIVTPEEDFIYELPKAKEFKEYNEGLSDIQYLVEDNDLWVKTSVYKENDKNYLIGTMNGENPKRNWYPTINTGFYYLKNQEYYMFSELVEHNFSEEALPIIKNLSYINNGAKLSNERSNLILDSSVKSIQKSKLV